MLNDKDVIILTLFFIAGCDHILCYRIWSALQSIFTEAAETCLFRFCVKKLIQHRCFQREQIFNTEKDGLVFNAGII